MTDSTRESSGSENPDERVAATAAEQDLDDLTPSQQGEDVRGGVVAGSYRYDPYKN